LFQNTPSVRSRISEKGSVSIHEGETRKIASVISRISTASCYCNITKCSTKVCPENITITDNAIIPLKERVVDEFFDPRN